MCTEDRKGANSEAPVDFHGGLLYVVVALWVLAYNSIHLKSVTRVLQRDVRQEYSLSWLAHACKARMPPPSMTHTSTQTQKPEACLRMHPIVHASSIPLCDSARSFTVCVIAN